MAIACAYLGHQ